MIEARGLVKTLGGNRVVDGVDLVCRAGEVVGLLGPNGAGKTTTLRLCHGFLRPDEGTVRIAGHDLATSGDEARRSLGVCTQDDTFDGDLTVRGNLAQTARYFRPVFLRAPRGTHSSGAARTDGRKYQCGFTVVSAPP